MTEGACAKIIRDGIILFTRSPSTASGPPPSRRDAAFVCRATLGVRWYIRLFFRVVVGANPYRCKLYAAQPLVCGGIYRLGGRSKNAPTVCMMLFGGRGRHLDAPQDVFARPIFLSCDRTQISRYGDKNGRRCLPFGVPIDVRHVITLYAQIWCLVRCCAAV